MKKNNINIYYMQKIFFLLIICLFILTGCNNKNDDEKLKSKIRDQISYLEKDLISMLNGFNNISYSNYKIEKRQGAQSSQTNTLIEENKKQGSTNGESLQETKQNNDSVEKSSNESESDNMNDNNSNASNQGNSSIIMVPNSILLSDINQKIDWNNMKYEIANEFGVNLGPDTTARANGSVGGEITKRLVKMGQEQMSRSSYNK